MTLGRRIKPTSRKYQVLRFLEACGERGATGGEIQEALGLGLDQATRPRTELLSEGRVRDSGIRRCGDSGHESIVWVAVPPDEWERRTAPADRVSDTLLDRVEALPREELEKLRDHIDKILRAPH